jgi:chromosome partitioning protein
MIVCGNTKGGVGKTTLAVQIALERQSASRTVLLVDAGGHDSEALRVALLRSDLLVVPVQPRAVDAWELDAMATMIDRAQMAREDEGRRPLRVLAALNLADPGDNRDNLDTLAALRDLPQFNVAVAIVRRRKAVANAMAHGLAVFEMQPIDRLARDEIAQLTDNVFGVEAS